MKPALKRDSVAGGVILNVLGQAAIVASGGLVSILLARHYGKEIFGQWSVAVVYGTMVGAIVEGGLGRVLVRDASRDAASAGKSLGAVLKGRVALSFVTVPLSLIAAWFLGNSFSAWILVLLSVLARCLQGLLGSYQAVLMAFEYYRAANLVETARRAAMLFAVAAIVALDLDIHWAAVATLIFTVVGTTYLMKLTREVVQVDYSASPKGYWRDAAWFWVNGILFWINGEIALLILSNMAGDAATGINSAAQRLAMLFLIIPRGVNNSVVPKLFRSAKDGKNLLRQLNATTMLLTAIATFAAVELWFNAEPIVHLVYSAKYAESAPALQAYGIFLMLNFMRTPPSWYLTTSDRLRAVTFFFVISGMVTIAGNIAFIPTYGGLATAWVCAIAEAVMLILATTMTVKHTGPKILIAFALGCVPGIVALSIHLALPAELPWLLSAGTVTVLFGAAMALTIKKLMRGWNPLGIFTS